MSVENKTQQFLINQPTVIKNIINGFLNDRDRAKMVEAVGYKMRESVFWCLKIQDSRNCPHIMMQMCGFGFYNHKPFRDFVDSISETEIFHFITYKNIQALTIIGKYRLFKPTFVGAIMFGQSKHKKLEPEFIKKVCFQLKVVIASDSAGVYFDNDEEFANCCLDRNTDRNKLASILAQKQIVLKRKYKKN